jgi:hypothetical protein
MGATHLYRAGRRKRCSRSGMAHVRAAHRVLARSPLAEAVGERGRQPRRVRTGVVSR